MSSKHLTDLLINQFRGVASRKRQIVVLLTPAVLFGGAIMLQSAHPAAKTSGSKNPESDANSPLVGQRDFSAKPVEDLGRGELFFKMTFSVVLVLVLGAAAVYLSKKVLPRITNLPGKEIRILETAHLGPRKAVHLIRIGNQRLLIGSTNESVTMLADVTDELQPLTAENAEPAEQEFSIPHSAVSASSAVKQITADLPPQQIDACVRTRVQ